MAILNIISFIFVATSAILLIIFAFKKSSRKSVQWEISVGEICYKCKTNTDKNSDDIYGKTTYTLCKKCERESKLNDFLNIKKNKSIDLFFVERNKCAKVYMFINALSIIFNFLGIFYRPLGVIGATFLVIGTSLMLKNFISTTIKKDLIN